jgi:hypothetical protein
MPGFANESAFAIESPRLNERPSSLRKEPLQLSFDGSASSPSVGARMGLSSPLVALLLPPVTARGAKMVALCDISSASRFIGRADAGPCERRSRSAPSVFSDFGVAGALTDVANNCCALIRGGERFSCGATALRAATGSVMFAVEIGGGRSNCIDSIGLGGSRAGDAVPRRFMSGETALRTIDEPARRNFGELFGDGLCGDDPGERPGERLCGERLPGGVPPGERLSVALSTAGAFDWDGELSACGTATVMASAPLAVDSTWLASVRRSESGEGRWRRPTLRGSAMFDRLAGCESEALELPLDE